MLGQRIKQFRLASSMSLDELVAATGGIVSKVALSKYERGIIKPSNRVLNSLAKVFNVKIIHLVNPPDIRVEFIAYRKGSTLSKKEQVNVESLVTSKLEDMIKIQDLLFHNSKPNLPLKHFHIKSLPDVETASVELRKKWKLGLDPIGSLTQSLENNFIHTIAIESDKPFDGISALAYSQNQLKAAAVVSKSNIPGERQRLNLAHELGHIVLNISPDVDEEKAAFRFGSAFLAPADTIYKIVGRKRDHFQIKELYLLKKIFGISIQSLLFRLKDLDIISSSSFSMWFRIINKNKWKKDEPMPMKEEKSQWFERNVLHAFSEGLISSDEAARLLGDDIDSQELSFIKKKEFMKLSIKDRERILSEETDKLAHFYETNKEWKDLGAGEFIEY